MPYMRSTYDSRQFPNVVYIRRLVAYMRSRCHVFEIIMPITVLDFMVENLSPQGSNIVHPWSNFCILEVSVL